MSDDFFNSLLDGLEAELFSSPQSSRPKPVSARSTASANKRIALDARAFTSPAQSPQRPALTLLSASRQAAFDSLCEGFDGFEAEDWDLTPSKKDCRKVASSHAIAPWTGRDARPPGHVHRANDFIRAVVESVELRSGHAGQATEKTLFVRCHTDKRYITVHLKDDWIQTNVQIDDVVHLIGLFDTPATFVVDRAENILIVHPDTLIAATRTADAAHCPRKPVLQEKIRSPNKASMASTYGNILHGVLQKCLASKTWDEAFRRREIDRQILEHANNLWEAECDFDEARMVAFERTATFEDWAKRYLGELVEAEATLTDPHGAKHEARAAIVAVHDIEEEILSPRFGLKGKVDVSILTRVVEHGADGDGRDSPPITVPLEIKTGRTLAMMEHRAQTMLYTLLMSERYDVEISSGFLFYTHGNDLIRVQAARNEIRGLVMARNDLASFLHVGLPASVESDDDECMPVNSTVANVSLLPTPIDAERACSRCYVNDACMLYRKAYPGDTLPIAEDSLQQLFESKTDALSDRHLDFFRQWERLISLEETDGMLNRKQIWTMSAAARERFGLCFADMIISKEEPSSTVGFRCSLIKYASAATNVLGGHISLNDPVLVSVMDGTYAVARGFVIGLSREVVEVAVDHSLSNLVCVPLSDRKTRFRIDRDELMAGMGKVRDNVAQLLYEKSDGRLRALVIDLAPPTFDKEALEKSLRARDYALVLGMPGCGKTQMIAALVRQLVENGKSVLLTSYTHSAVDNILLRLRDLGSTILRLGKADKVMPELHDFLEEAKQPASSLHDLDDRLMHPQVVATSALAVLSHALFSRRRFDICIVDEASQITLPACLGPLRFADRFVLVGDHHQLPPLVRSASARQGGMDVSLFARLCQAHPTAMVRLSQQYRMNADIMAICNRLVYEGRLTCGSNDVATRTLNLPRWRSVIANNGASWLSKAVDPARAVLYIDTDDVDSLSESRVGRLVQNAGEADLVAKLTSVLLDSGLPADEMAVLTPYRQQLKTIRAALQHPSAASIEIMTADRSQGRDKQCVILSLVRNNQRQQVGELLQDWRRLNVCFTRAKAKLIVFGSRSTLGEVPQLREFFQLAEERGWACRVDDKAEMMRRPLGVLGTNMH